MTKPSEEAKESKILIIGEGQDILQALKFYLVPIFSIAVFILIAIFRVLPSITTVISGFEARGNIDKEITLKEEELNVLKNLKNDRTMEIDLEDVEKVVPSSSFEVVDFIEKVKKIAAEQGLEVQGTKTGETRKMTQGVEGDIGKVTYVVEIPTTITVRGNLGDVYKFLEALYSMDNLTTFKWVEVREHVVQVEEETTEQPVTQGEAEGYWVSEITFFVYRFPEDFSQGEDLKGISPTTVPNDEILEKVKEKSS